MPVALPRSAPEDRDVPAQPTPEVVHSRGWQIGLGAVLAALLFAFGGGLIELVTLWTSRADYSHGFLVVSFAVYLLWRRRAQFPSKLRWPDPWGVPFFGVGALLYAVADRINIAREWLMAAGLALALAGAVVMFCGRWKGLRWAWPALAFLPLAFPLPHRIEQTVSLKLRVIATQASNFAFQTLGLPSYAEANKIHIGDVPLDVAEPCAGLSMLLIFVFFSAAIAMLYESRPVIDRLVVLASGVPIAVGCNVLRIVATGLVYYAGWRQFGDLLFHDLAGWLMMPLALGFTWLLLKAIDWVVEPVDRLSTEEALGLRFKRKPAAPPAASPPGVPNPAPGPTP